MIKEIIIIAVIIGICFLIFIIPKFKNPKQEYQGPVRPTDDLEYFRETGITKPLEESDNGR